MANIINENTLDNYNEIRVKFDAYNKMQFAIVELNARNSHIVISSDESLLNAIKLAKEYYKEMFLEHILYCSEDEIIKIVNKLRGTLMEIEAIYENFTNV